MFKLVFSFLLLLSACADVILNSHALSDPLPNPQSVNPSQIFSYSGVIGENVWHLALTCRLEELVSQISQNQLDFQSDAIVSYNSDVSLKPEDVFRHLLESHGRPVNSQSTVIRVTPRPLPQCPIDTDYNQQHQPPHRNPKQPVIVRHPTWTTRLQTLLIPSLVLNCMVVIYILSNVYYQRSPNTASQTPTTTHSEPTSDVSNLSLSPPLAPQPRPTDPPNVFAVEQPANLLPSIEERFWSRESSPRLAGLSHPSQDNPDTQHRAPDPSHHSWSEPSEAASSVQLTRRGFDSGPHPRGTTTPLSMTNNTTSQNPSVIDVVFASDTGTRSNRKKARKSSTDSDDDNDNDNTKEEEEEEQDESTTQNSQHTPDQPAKEFRFLVCEGRYCSEFDEVRKLGRGGFGDVYECRNRMTKVQYAIKKVAVTISRRISAAEASISNELALREVSISASLNHVNVVRYYSAWLETTSVQSTLGSIGIDDTATSMFDTLSTTHSHSAAQPALRPTSVLYIQMELCKDGTLARQLAIPSRVPNQRQVWDILLQALKAIQYVHERGYIHRDIKPSNIFFDSGRLKLGDFGCSRASRALARMSSPTGGDEEVAEEEEEGMNGTPRAGVTGLLSTHTSPNSSRLISLDATDALDVSPHHVMAVMSSKTSGVGTWVYAAPEQIHQRRYNEKSDVYSLGIVLFETLHLPFNTASERASEFTRVRTTGLVGSQIETQFPREASLIQRMIAADPNQRPSVKELIQEVAFWQDRGNL